MDFAAATLSDNSLRQTVHTHRASVHQASKSLAALLRVARVTADLGKVMAAYCRVYDSHHLQADCQELRSAPEPYAQSSSMSYLTLILEIWLMWTVCVCVSCVCVSDSSAECPASLLLYQRTFSKHFHNFVELCLLSEPISRSVAAASQKFWQL